MTGGGRGIGRAIAERLATAGLHVVVAGRTEAELHEVAAGVGGVALRLDVGDRGSRELAVAWLAERGLAIDVLVNNAGIAESASFDRTTDDAWERMMAVNATGAFALCRALVPGMLERGFGRVVNVASNAGITGYAYTTAYCASKHAMVGLTRALALEVARANVTVNAVCPGWVDTRMAEEAAANIARTTGREPAAARRALEAMSPQRRLVTPAEVAHVVAMLVGDDARGVNGQAIAIDGGQVMP